MLDLQFVAQLIVIVLDTFINTCYLLTEAQGHWFVNLAFLIVQLVAIAMYIKIPNINKKIIKQYGMLLLLVAYTEIQLQWPCLLILLGHFQQTLLHKSRPQRSRVIGLTYIMIRLALQYQDMAIWIVVKFVILAAPIAIKIFPRAIKDEENQLKLEQQNIKDLVPIEILGLIASPQFAIYKNTSSICCYSNLKQEEIGNLSFRKEKSKTPLETLPLSARDSNERGRRINEGHQRLIQNPSTAGNIQETLPSLINRIFKEQTDFSKQIQIMFQEDSGKCMQAQSLSVHSDRYIVVSLLERKEDRFAEQQLQFKKRIMRNVHKVAHDMKTPLNAIINLQSCLTDYIEPFYNQRYLKPSLNSCKLLMNLLDDILDSAQIESQKLRIVNRAFNLNKLIQKTLSLFEIQALARQISIQVYNNVQTSTIVTDKNRLRQILMNLISNALKYTEPKGQIGIWLNPLENSQIQIEVEDNGIGIKEENLHLLFHDFNKVSDRENELLNEKGVGLGLQISKELAILMGSKNGIQVKSTYGKGTTFTFSITNYSDEESVMEQTFEPLAMKMDHLNINKNQQHFIPLAAQQKEKNFQKNSKVSIKFSPTVSINIPKISIRGPLAAQQSSDNFNEVRLSVQHDSSTKHQQFFGSKVRSASYQEIGSDYYMNPQLSKQVLERTVSKVRETSDLMIKTLLSSWKDRLSGQSEVLVVDDNEYNTMALKFLLESIGLFADTAISGHEAIDIVTQRENENKPFQCIFMDLEMTGLNGFQTTKRIHQLNPRLPVFACSGWNDQQTIEDCKQAGMLDIIPKPVQKQHVRRLLKAHFENLRADPSQKCITMKD